MIIAVRHNSSFIVTLFEDYQNNSMRGCITGLSQPTSQIMCLVDLWNGHGTFSGLFIRPLCVKHV